MSSSKRNKTSPIALALCLAFGMALSACQVRPLYSTNSETGTNLSAELAAIEISPAADRVEQELRNNLIFAFTGGGQPDTPRYKLLIDLKNESSNFSIEKGTGLSSSEKVILTATYKLTSNDEKTVLTTGSSIFTAHYSKVTQRYANERALLDAENRAAKLVADDIHLRLSAFFAAGN